MHKSPKVRSPLAVALAAGTLCVGAGCVNGPQAVETPPPPPIPCPPGVGRTNMEHHLGWATRVRFELTASGEGTVPKDGTLRVQLADVWGDLPLDTPLLGRAWFGRDYVYGRLTEVILPSGAHLPVCLDLNANGPGVPVKPGSSRTKIILITRVVAAFAPTDSTNP